ncbi:hypothetical protein BN1708_013638 [Verticillium longisporum]|uniref:CST complex subunit Ten1 n=1 Tax=Verticillium longisporum TaxID=100787 RepID=A0A0G4LMJ0_VERLO|nr:hypothetical protein HYQ44_008215 [Verticillium longisporum]CRK23169.1 hypothetical protein BN1708_013638 [Verticillium longisporum]
MSRGPLPSQICLLADLSVKSPGDKVRFLGCVTAYTVATATLVLCHSFPSGTDTAAHVDVKLVLESLTGEQVRIGEWVNIIGYITSKVLKDASQYAHQPTSSRNEVSVQALLLWSAGPMQVQRYEELLSSNKNYAA